MNKVVMRNGEWVEILSISSQCLLVWDWMNRWRDPKSKEEMVLIKMKRTVKNAR